MPTVVELIGQRFENFLSDNLTDLVYSEDVFDSSKSYPDFYSHSGFWIEAKTNNRKPDFGSRIKSYQVVNFKKLEEPVIYAIGIHDFDEAYVRLEGLSLEDRQILLEREMRITRMYFISSKIIENIYEKENKSNKKGNIKYCVLKEAFLRGIINDKKISRNGENEIGMREYFLLPKIESSFFILPPVRSEELQCDVGWILDKKKEVGVINYLSKHI